MEPQFEMPDVPDLDAREEGAIRDDKYEDLLRASEERKRSLEKLQLSVVMLKEMHNATVLAFREELQRSVRLRLEVEMRATLDHDEHTRRTSALEADYKRRVGKLHAQFVALWTEFDALVNALPTFDQVPDLIEAKGPLATALREAREVLAVAAEYLD